MRSCASTLVAAVALLVPAREAARTTEHRIPNMNGEYVVANSDAFPTNFMSYPGGVESFDAYHGPITSTYSQVWWTSMQASEFARSARPKFKHQLDGPATIFGPTGDALRASKGASESAVS